MMGENFLGLLCLLMSTATNVQPPSGCTDILHSSMVNSSTSTIILKTIKTVTPSALLMAGGILKTNKSDNKNITDFSYALAPPGFHTDVTNHPTQSKNSDFFGA